MVPVPSLGTGPISSVDALAKTHFIDNMTAPPRVGWVAGFSPDDVAELAERREKEDTW